MAKTGMGSAIDQFRAQMEQAEVPQMLEAEKWNRDEMPVLIGKLLEYKHIVMKSGDEGDQVVVEEPDGTLTRFWMTMGLQSQWDEWQPQVGETIGVKFHGAVATQSGNTFNQFTLNVMGREAPAPAPKPKAPPRAGTGSRRRRRPIRRRVMENFSKNFTKRFTLWLTSWYTLYGTGQQPNKVRGCSQFSRQAAPPDTTTEGV